ncbi:MAG TPA: hypothetical protein VFC78_13495 [Tepidisphaeraceae bacterium]|nr:hypothetical protein [Tepidisphaeraceae bacterium]
MSDLLHSPQIPESREDSHSLAPHAYDGWLSHAIRHRPEFVEQFVGIILNAPCANAGAGDYADARYYVQRGVPVRSMGAGDVLSAQAEAIPGVAQCVTATNLAELADQTHLLIAGSLVQVFALHTRGSPGAKVYVFNQPPVDDAVVKITGPAGGAGEYLGQILGGKSNASASTNLAMPAGLSATLNALILNTEEDGLTGHRLASGSYAVGVVRGTTTDSPPRTIVVVRGGLGSQASPLTVCSTSNTSESPDTSTWSRDTDGLPINLYVVSRTVYNPAGDQTLYQFIRKLSFDARGILYAVSAETRDVVDVTEPCP